MPSLEEDDKITSLNIKQWKVSRGTIKAIVPYIIVRYLLNYRTEITDYYRTDLAISRQNSGTDFGINIFFLDLITMNS